MGLAVHILYMAWCAACAQAAGSGIACCLPSMPSYLPALHGWPRSSCGPWRFALPRCRVSAAFYATVTWLPDEMREAGLKHIVSQGIVV